MVPSGVEPELIQKYANAHGLQVEWREQSEQALFEALENFELDVGVAGLTDATPWKGKIAITRPYQETQNARGETQKHVLALPPGENGWLMELERFLSATGARKTGLPEEKP